MGNGKFEEREMIQINNDYYLNFTGERYIPGEIEGDIVVEHLQRYKSVLEFVSGKIVVDAACGEGYGSSILASKAEKVYGIDISHETILYAKKKYSDDNLEYICSSIEKLPFPDSSVDIVISFETIEHVQEKVQIKFLQEIKRILKDDGILIISSPDKLKYSDEKQYKNPYHIKEFYFEEFQKFLGGCFSNISLFHQGITKISLGTISSADSLGGIVPRIIGDMIFDNNEAQYIIAICSDQCLESANILETVMQVFDTSRPILFIDTGHYFNEDEKIVSNSIVYKKNLFVRFDLSKFRDIKKLRFDPLEGYPCVCQILNIDTDAQNVTINPMNEEYIDHNDKYVFMNIDPMIEIIGDFTSVSYLELQYKLRTLESSEVFSNFQNMRNLYNSTIEERDILRNKLEVIYNSNSYKLIKKIQDISNSLFLFFGKNKDRG